MKKILLSLLCLSMLSFTVLAADAEMQKCKQNLSNCSKMKSQKCYKKCPLKVKGQKNEKMGQCKSKCQKQKKSHCGDFKNGQFKQGEFGKCNSGKCRKCPSLDKKHKRYSDPEKESKE